MLLLLKLIVWAVRALAIVKTATVVAWHRCVYRAYWRRISRTPGRPRTEAQLRDLIRRMAKVGRAEGPPITRAVCPQISPGATVASLSRVGGLHHRYEWRDAA